MSSPMGMVTTEVSGPVLVVRVDDGKANASTRQAIGEIIAAVERAEVRRRDSGDRPAGPAGSLQWWVRPLGDARRRHRGDQRAGERRW
ncbi:MAG: hypothetical protein V9E89_16020 [Ilumatobacteraceae bacterium]